MPSSKFLKTTAICGIGAAASFLSVGVTVANASIAKTTKITKTPKPTTKTPKPTATKSGTFLGAPAMTQFGPVQVSISVTNGKITKVISPVYPVGTFRDQQINAQAIPWLEQEVLKVQSSNIQGIGGASYTSEGFYISLISALAKAGLK